MSGFDNWTELTDEQKARINRKWVESSGDTQRKPGGLFCRRWVFELRDNEIHVCEGRHEKSEACSFRPMSAAEALGVIERLRQIALIHDH